MENQETLATQGIQVTGQKKTQITKKKSNMEPP